VRAGSLKSKRFVIRRVDQNPVRFDVTIARGLPRPGEGMVPINRRKRRSFGQKPDNFLKLTQVLASFPHASRVSDKLAGLRASSVLVQPRNQGTAPAIAYSLLRLRELDPAAVVAFFPSDHHFANEERFVACVNAAFEAAECPYGPVVLLGVVPDAPEAAYGWIEPGAPLGSDAGPAFRVSRFWEKPALSLALGLMDRGCLWNSFVMVGRVGSFLRMTRRALPDLVQTFDSLRHTFFTCLEELALLELYSSIRSSSFSDDVLAVRPDDLAVLPGKDLGWSDLGEIPRVLSLLKRKGVRHECTQGWAIESSAAS